jgi:hypothetical protein
MTARTQKKPIPTTRQRPEAKIRRRPAEVVALPIKRRPFAEFSLEVAEFLEDCDYSEVRQT